jgi:cysteine-S-conjugate beta-lyase
MTDDAIAPIEALRARRSEKWQKYSRDVLPLFVAEMDVALAPEIRDELRAAIERSDTGYAWPRPLRETFVRYAKARFDWDLSPRDVTVVNDVMGGIAEALRSLTQRGDGVVIMPPVYPPFFEIIANTERRVVEVPLLRESDWSIDAGALESALASRAQALLLCHPHNPVGRVWSENDLHVVAALAQRYGTLVISDEIHAPLVYAGAAHVPFALVAKPFGIDSVTLMSASKGWNIAGLKCAQMIAGSESVRRGFGALPRDVRDRIGHLGVIATIAAYDRGCEWMDETLASLDAGRALLTGLLAEHLPAVRYRPPQATYLAWLDFGNYGLGDDPAQALLERAKVALAHGPDFGRAGRGFARLNFATSREIVAEAVERIAAALNR